jgi:predicted  nucleic acid-binding Zn-ribbon protein
MPDPGLEEILRATYGYADPAVVGALERRVLVLQLVREQETDEAAVERLRPKLDRAYAFDRDAFRTQEGQLRTARGCIETLREEVRVLRKRVTELEHQRVGWDGTLVAARREAYAIRSDYERLERECRAARYEMHQAHAENLRLIRANELLRAQCEVLQQVPAP